MEIFGGISGVEPSVSATRVIYTSRRIANTEMDRVMGARHATRQETVRHCTGYSPTAELPRHEITRAATGGSNREVSGNTNYEKVTISFTQEATSTPHTYIQKQS
jgi:hypothetical protein